MQLHSLNRTLFREEFNPYLILAHLKPVDVLLAPDGTLQSTIGDITMHYIELDEEVYPLGQLKQQLCVNL